MKSFATHNSATCLILFLLTLVGCADEPRQYVPGPEEGEELLGGDTTVFDETGNAFALAARNLDREGRRAFAVGNAFFNDNWVIAPASTEGRDGLGPLFNARSCSSCHFRDGRGRPPEPGERAVGYLIRLSVPGSGDDAGNPTAHPVYGTQLQTNSIPGVPTEGRVRIEYKVVSGTFDDGTPYELIEPRPVIVQQAYGPLPENVQMSPRVAPAVHGMGLLEAIPEETILGLADPDDADGDGISGRPNYVPDVQSGEVVLGRFGWKANQPSVRQQSAGAFNGDIGITSSLFADENHTDEQTAARDAPNGGEPELDDHKLTRVTEYIQTLGVPARRDWDNEEVLNGKRLFGEAGCHRCHIPFIQTGNHEQAAVSNQTIRPYTDLLLHDMGPGLADGRPDHEATGSEWRTPPLWGIGLVETVNKHTRFLHDGRARNLSEAILWHGGEAQSSRDHYLSMSAEDRRALLRFLGSL